ncbi:MAG: hypothetical protein Q8P35_00985 [Candidatus Yanofskybacteria bacterium]|nr:hypothetical protein [Candidatus Yanofskybacteria bacterium]
MNIKTNFILTCEQAFLTAHTNNLNLIGIFTNINAEHFPLVYRRFDLIINFDIDTPGIRTLRTVVTDNEGATIVQSDVAVNVTSATFQVITHFENLTFAKPGKYELKVYVDNHYIGSRVLTVNPVLQQKTNIA